MLATNNERKSLLRADEKISQHIFIGNVCARNCKCFTKFCMMFQYGYTQGAKLHMNNQNAQANVVFASKVNE